MSTNADTDALASAVRARRAGLGLTHDEVLARGGPSGVTLTKIEMARGPAPSAATLKKLDLALDWAQGSALGVLNGGEPVPLEHSGPHDVAAPSAGEPGSGAEHLTAMSSVLAQMVAVTADLLTGASLPPKVRAQVERAIADFDKANELLGPMTHVPEVAVAYMKEADKFAQVATEVIRSSFPPNVTNLADRRPVPPPPNIDELDVATSRREKLSDGERDDEDGPHELSLSDKKSRRKIKYEFNSSAEAYEYAREFLIAEGEKPHLVDAALGDAGRHIADTSARGWAVRIRKIAGRAAASHEDE